MAELWNQAPPNQTLQQLSQNGLPANLTAPQVAALQNPRIAPTPANVLFRFDGSNTTAYTVTHTGTGGTSSIDTTTSPFTGRNAGASLKVNAASTRTEVEITGLAIANWDGHVVFNCSVEDHTGTGLQFSVFAGTSGYGRFFVNTHRVTAGTQPNARNGFHSMPIGPMANDDVSSSTAVWTAGANSTFLRGTDTLQSVKLRINGDGVGTRVGAVWIHSISLVPRGRPTVLMTYDDASRWLDAAVPHLEANGLRGTFGIMTGAVGTNPALYLSVADVQAIAASGHELCSHNVANTALASPYDAAASDTYAAAFRTGMNNLAGWIGDKASTAYHPWVQGVSTDLAVKRLRAHGVRMARMAGVTRHNIIAGAPGGGVFDGLMQLRSIGTYDGSAGSGPLFTNSVIDQILDDCERYGTTVCFMVHEVQDAETGIQTSVAKHRYICEQLARRSGITKLRASEYLRQCQDEGLSL